MLVSGSLRGDVILWDFDSGKILRKLNYYNGTDFTGEIYGIKISPCGNYVLAGGEDKILRLWYLGSGQEALNIHIDTVIKDVAIAL